jgi:NAD(P)-dependent dehydrogenase (short-subunit alcohol dehydrogenase family)
VITEANWQGDEDSSSRDLRIARFVGRAIATLMQNADAAIAPTFVETNLTRARLRNPEFRSFVLGKIPSGNLALPEHIAAAAVYLASEEASMVNCETHRVDGGWTAW